MLNKFISKLATASEMEEAMYLVATKLCEDLDAESAGIFVPDKQTDGELLRGVACTGYFPILTEDANLSNAKIRENARNRMAHFHSELARPGYGPIGQAMVKHEPILYFRDPVIISPWPLPDEVKTMMVMPLMNEDKFVGAICVVNRHKDISPFSAHDLNTFKQLSVQPALACSLVMIYADRSRQDRLKRELEVCTELQKSMLPDIPSQQGEYSFATINKPAFEVSGDYYDFVQIDESHILVMVADATGKGLPACLMTSMARSFVRAMIEKHNDLQSLLLDVNRLLFSNSDTSRFLTMNIMMIDTKNNTCEFGCAGHTPLLIKHENGHCESIKPKGVALGMWPNDFPDLFETQKFDFEPGMSVCMFTDGINEALDKDKQEFGVKRLEAQWRKTASDPQDAINRIIREVRDFSKDEPQADDQTILVIKRKQT